MKIYKRNILFIFGLLLLTEIFSFFGYLLPEFRQISFLFITALVLILTLYHFEYGILILFAELLIGSKGYLFYYNIGGIEISIRIAIWLIIMSIWGSKFIMRLIRNKKDTLEEIGRIPYSNNFFILFLFIIFAIVNGFLNHNSFNNIFFDFNGWFFFALLFPISEFLNQYNLKGLCELSVAAISWLIIKTYFLLFVFSHNMIGMVYELYRWVRESGVGEITQLPGGFQRIFFQSHIYILLFFFIMLILISGKIINKENKFDFKSNHLTKFIFLATLLSVIILTLSRSFWVGLASGLFIYFISVIKKYNWKNFLKFSAILLIALLISLSMIIAVVKFPYPRSVAGLEALSERLTQTNEAAVSSRWQLLPPLWQKIKSSPILGKGFGTEVTYISSDPRVLESSPTGEYTTYAFEWGWLDLWLKLGLLGLVAYIALLFKIIYYGIKSGVSFKFGLALGIFALCAVNIFTPYLNHPLGIGYILISGIIIGSKNCIIKN